MICVEICVGSSCCIKGSEEIIRLFREALDRGQIHNLATLQSAGQALGRIGGRSNIAESVISSNDDLRDIKKEARATIAEADSVESASNLIQAQNALSMAQRTFSMISQTSLMDYIS